MSTYSPKDSLYSYYNREMSATRQGRGIFLSEAAGFQ
jgi:hypothetical protein